MHILISSHCPFNITGYGNQTRYMIKMFTTLGYTVSVLMWDMYIKSNNKGFTPQELYNILHTRCTIIPDKVFKSVKKYYTRPCENWPCTISSPNIINEIIKNSYADLLIYHLDVFNLNFNEKFIIKSFACLPIHYDPLEKLTVKYIDKFDKIICLSNFGKKVLLDSCPDIKSSIIPLVADLDVFYPVSLEKKQQLRKEKNIPVNGFIMLLLANNCEKSNRKAFDVQIAAAGKIINMYDNCYLYIHSILDGTINLNKLIVNAKIEKTKLFTANQQTLEKKEYSAEDISNLYKMVDITLMASKSEGFGLPILESQACGCPVVTTNFSTMPEITWNGISTKPKKKEHKKDFDTYWVKPSIKNVVNAIKEIKNWSPEIRKKKK